METEYEAGDILVVYSDLDKEDYYFLIEGERELVDLRMESMYPYRCLNDGRTGWGNFNYPGTRKVA